jgi:hypothetical protein
MFGFLSCAWLVTATHISEADITSTVKLRPNNLGFIFCFSWFGFELISEYGNGAHRRGT